MMLFELFLTPVVTILAVALYSRERGNIIFPLSTFIIGAVFFFPGIFLFYLFRGIFPLAFSGTAMYLHYFYQDHLLHIVFSTIGLVLLRMFLQKTTHDNYVFRAVAYYGGYYSLVSCFYFLENFSHLNPHVLFVLPLLHCSMVLLASIAFSQFHNRDGLERVLPLALLLVPAAVMGFVSSLPMHNNLVIAIILAVIVAGASGFAFVKLKDY
ncbi:MAG: hypothetical protein JW904_09960 [Spirochaetales bacterium]|nr:hypothetical protein [Spirochaetales bacterium]